MFVGVVWCVRPSAVCAACLSASPCAPTATRGAITVPSSLPCVQRHARRRVLSGRDGPPLEMRCEDSSRALPLISADEGPGTRSDGCVCRWHYFAPRPPRTYPRRGRKGTRLHHRYLCLSHECRQSAAVSHTYPVEPRSRLTRKNVSVAVPRQQTAAHTARFQQLQSKGSPCRLSTVRPRAMRSRPRSARAQTSRRASPTGSSSCSSLPSRCSACGSVFSPSRPFSPFSGRRS